MVILLAKPGSVVVSKQLNLFLPLHTQSKHLVEHAMHQCVMRVMCDIYMYTQETISGNIPWIFYSCTIK